MIGRRSARNLLLFSGLILTGCTEVPSLDATITPDLKSSDYPKLVPIQTLLVPLPPPATESEALKDDLEARRDRLRERAARLRETPVVDTETEARMKAGIQG